MNLSVLIFGWLLSVVIVFGNGFTILLITRRPSLRSTAGGIFILSLAVADFCLGFTFFPLQFVGNRHEDWSNYLRVFFQLVFQYASLVNLCALVADRYFSIVFPLRYTNFITPKRTYTILFASWMVSVVVAVLGIIHLLTGAYEIALATAHTVLFTITPTLILVVTTIHLMTVVRKLRRQTLLVSAQLSFNKMSCNVSANRCYREFDYVKVIAVLMCFFGIFSFMDILSNICLLANISQCKGSKIDNAVMILQLTNSTINPFVYALLKKDFIKEAKCLLGHRPMANAAEI